MSESGESGLKRCPTCARIFDPTETFCDRDGSPLELARKADTLVGRTIQGRFLIESRIGQGGMGAVYKARQVSVDRPVALKIVHPHLTNDERVPRRFLVEARAVSRLRSPHTVTLYDFGQTEDGLLFMAMEYLEGMDLGDVLARRGALSVEQTLHILDGVAASLAEAHAQEIVHRDLKPENIFLARGPAQAGSDDGEIVKVLDFGIARATGIGGTRLTRTGTVAGTPQYMAPESVVAGDQDARVDVYALGVLFYEMLAGKRPYDGENPVAVMMMHLQQEPEPLEVARPGLVVPDGVTDLMWRCLAKHRDRRPADAGVLRHYLTKLRDAPHTPVTPTAGGRARASSTSDGFRLDPSVIELALPVGEIVTDVETAAATRDGPGRGFWIAVVAAWLVALSLGAWWQLGGPPSDDPESGESPAAAATAPEPSPAPTALPVASEPSAEKRPPAPSPRRPRLPRAVETPYEAPHRTARREADDAPAPRARLAPVTDARAPRPDAVKVTIRSRPGGATVWLGDERRGKAPVELALPWSSSGTVAIRCTRAGFRPAELSVRPDSDKIARCTLRKRKLSEDLPD